MRVQKIVSLFLLCALLQPPWIPSWTEAKQATRQESAGATLIEASESHLIIEWRAPAYRLERASRGQPAYDALSVPGCPSAGNPGEPALPVCSVLVGIPPEVEVQLTVLDVEGARLSGTVRLGPVPTPEAAPFPRDGMDGPAQPVEAVAREGPVYRSDTPFPEAPAVLGPPAFLRHQRLVPVIFYPFQYRPASGELYHYSTVRVALTFLGNRGITASIAEPEPFERLLKARLLNYDQARKWRTSVLPPLQLPPLPPSPGYRIPVRQAGIYRLTYADLQAAGLPVDTLDPRTLRLFRYGVEVAIQITGEEDARLDPGDELLFYGQPLAGNRYSATEVYWLTYGGEPGLRIPSRPAPPQGTAPVPAWFAVSERREQNALYYPYAPWRPDHDHWFWNYLFPQAGVYQQDYLFPAHALSSEPYTATLRFYLYSLTSVPSIYPDHHLRALLNGVQVGEWWWDGKQEMTATVHFPSSLLQSAGNTVRLICPGDTGAELEFVAVDWVELDERRLFAAEDGRLEWTGAQGPYEYHIAGFASADILLWDITDPDRPTAVVSGTVVPAGGGYELRFEDTVTGNIRYLAAVPGAFLSPDPISPAEMVDLRNPANGADYLVITHPAFSAQAETLVALRAGQGLRARAVPVQAIYDAFAYGRALPDAIQDFLAYAYAAWAPPAPSYVVLFGDGHYDYKNYLGYGVGNWIPPYLAFVDPWIGEVAADNRYACLSGDDAVADMLLGRLPANTVAEAQAMVDKVVRYETMPPPGRWRSISLFVADDADSAGNFDDLSDALIAGYYPAPYEAERVYLGVTHPYERPSIVARNAIISAINQGRLLVNYIGHAGTALWAAERLLDNPDLNDLHNDPYYPVAVPMTCYEGMYYDPHPNPSYFALAEVFVRAAGKGWLASWSPTGPGVAMGHHFLNEGFFQSLFLDDDPHLGPATLSGKLRLYASGSSLELLDTFLLLGDPAIALPLLPSGVRLSKEVEPARPLHPGERITYTLDLENAGPATAHHLVLTDVLPAAVFSPTVFAVGITLTPRLGFPFSWQVSDLAAGQGGRVTIAGRVAITAPAGFMANHAYLRLSNPRDDPSDNADWAMSLIAAGPPSQIAAAVTPSSLPADGRSLAVVRAVVRDLAGLPVADGTVVRFLTDAGSFYGGMETYSGTTHLGVAEALLRAGNEVTTATVSLAAGDAWAQVAVPLEPLAPYTVTVHVEPLAIAPTATAAITVSVCDRLGHPVRDGTPVELLATLGVLTPSVALTWAGKAHATLEGDGHPGWATIVASSGGASGVARVRIGEPNSVTLALAAHPRELLADGQSRAQVTATLQLASGQPVTATRWVYFYSTLGDIPSRALAISGTARLSFTAGLQTGKAALAAWSEATSAFDEILLRPGAAAAISVTAIPAAIPVDGHRALVRAAVRDPWDHPVADATPVSLSASLGTLTPTLGLTWEGAVEAVLTSGTRAGASEIVASSEAVTGSAWVSFLPLEPAGLSLWAEPDLLVADGVSTATLRCWVQDRYANPVADGTRVAWGATMGNLWPAESFTSRGWATATLRAGTVVGNGVVWAVVGAISGTIPVRFIPGPPATLLVTASSSRLVADGVSTATIRAAAWDCVGHPVADDTEVTFTTTLGEVVPTIGWTQGGVVTATLRSAREPGTARVRATSGAVWGEVWVEFYRYAIYLPLVLRHSDGG